MKLSTNHRAHLAEAFRWTTVAPLDARALVMATFAMAVPIFAGFALGRPSLGFVVGLGSMLLANEAPGQAGAAHSPGGAIVPALLAVAVSMPLARAPWGEAAMIPLVMAAATLTSYSRPAAAGAIRFIIFLVLNLGLLGSGGTHRGGAALLFGLGALWRAVLRGVFGKPGHRAPAQAEASARVPTPAQRRAHWRRALGRLEGWQYPIRLGAGLAIACLIRDLWPARHFDWIVLTIALLTPRAIEHLPVQITQRVAGTLAGVALAGAILHLAPSHLVLAVVACLLGVAAPVARAGNYAAYCVLATPVILLAMDAGAAAGDGLLVDRLAATIGGAAIILLANLAMDRWLLAVSRPAPAR